LLAIEPARAQLQIKIERSCGTALLIIKPLLKSLPYERQLEWHVLTDHD